MRQQREQRCGPRKPPWLCTEGKCEYPKVRGDLCLVHADQARRAKRRRVTP